MPLRPRARLVIGAGTARRLCAVAAGAAIAGGLYLGVATAADPAGHPPPGGTPPAAATAAAGDRSNAARTAPLRPLHHLIAGKLRTGTGPFAAPRRIVVGRLVRLTGTMAIVDAANGGRRQIRITPQTRLPKRHPRPGEAVIVLGQQAPDGTFRARALLIRPGGPAVAA